MDLSNNIRVIPDFPKPGISVKDVTPSLKDPALFQQAIDDLAGACRSRDFDLIVCPEARGFIFGSALAYVIIFTWHQTQQWFNLDSSNWGSNAVALGLAVIGMVAIEVVNRLLPVVVGDDADPADVVAAEEPSAAPSH